MNGIGLSEAIKRLKNISEKIFKDFYDIPEEKDRDIKILIKELQDL
ncbi:2618_t:CDS:2 [Cetraspora pellucida]|uniref:2618_t:CDS:1 n=1 Tax=Cetraspora pellucida TaxID=1433469 RepID=A0A9N9FM36_9GLOM|nr:2618_t:CDS:2 [Cetraspora pellucida]